MKKSKHIFFGFIARQDKLTKSWNIELGVVTFLCVSSLVAFSHQYGILAWVPLYFLVTIIMGIVSSCKTSALYRLTQLAALVISRHKSERLKHIFDRSKTYLAWIILLDILYPATWAISFMVKLAFIVNSRNMKMLITDSDKSE